MSVTLVKYRYGSRIEKEFPSLERAYEEAFVDHAFGEAYPTEILDQSGNRLADHNDLLAYYKTQP
jgi:hypothetical protein